MRHRSLFPVALSLSACLLMDATAATPVQQDKHVLLIVWDGLRPDMVSEADTPILAGLRASGVDFTDHHSTYPTLTMINASSFATGAFPGTHGFYGNWIWIPQAQGRDSLDRVVDFQQPVFTEDYGILQSIDAAEGGRLFTVPTVFEVAARAGLSVAVVGKGGPTFLQNRHGTTTFLDDRTAMPADFLEALRKSPIPPPRFSGYTYPADPRSTIPALDPAANGRVPVLKDGATSDPTQPDAAAFVGTNLYYARVFNEYVLPISRPNLAMLWLRNPDGTEHPFGPGSAATHQALRANDAVLGSVLARLDALGLRSSTNIMVVSDHGHSHVSGPFDLFPLRAIADGVIGNADPNGFSVSGEVRTADLLKRAGIPAYDGMHAQCDAIMSGIGTDGQSILLHQPIDAKFDCKTNGIETTGDFALPGRPPREPYAVIALDGGSEYFYIPSRNRAFVLKIVRFLQSHRQYGAIFADSRRYGDLPGTLPLAAVHLANAQGRNPDLIVSYAFDANARISGTPGIEFTSAGAAGRGTHGSFSPRDVHNVLIANGPAFKAGFHRDELPSANVDVAPTIAAILGLSLPTADGRPLNEALRDARNQPQRLGDQVLKPTQSATQLQMVGPLDPDGRTVDATSTQYTFELHTKLIREGGHDYRYFDSADVLRD